MVAQTNGKNDNQSDCNANNNNECCSLYNTIQFNNADGVLNKNDEQTRLTITNGQTTEFI